MSEWKQDSLGGLVNFQKGRKVDVYDSPENDRLPYLGAAVLSGAVPGEFASPIGAVLATNLDVLMLWDGERSGLVGRGMEGVVASTVSKLSMKGPVASGFLYYALFRKFPWIQGRRTGTGVPHVPKDLNRILSIEFPTGTKEQSDIAEVLTTIDEAIERTEALIAKTQKIKMGLMHDLFTRGVTENGELRPTHSEAPHLYKESPLGWIPKEWDSKAIEKLLANTACPMRSGPFGSALLKDELVENGVPLLGIDNIFSERFSTEYRRFVTRSKFEELRRYSVFPRDVIITIMGTVGRCCVVPDDIGPALSSKHLWTMTFDQSAVIPELVCWQLGYASWTKSWFARQSQGAVMEAIQSSTLRQLQLPVPKMDEQKIIFARYESIQCELAIANRQHDKLVQIKSGLMHDLLTGKVRVPEGVVRV